MTELNLEKYTNRSLGYWSIIVGALELVLDCVVRSHRSMPPKCMELRYRLLTLKCQELRYQLTQQSSMTITGNVLALASVAFLLIARES